MGCLELRFWTSGVLSFAVGLCIFWVKIVFYLCSESGGNFTLSALASCRARMGKRCGCSNPLDVCPFTTVLSSPADSELWQEHTCSTQVGFPKGCFSQHGPRSLWPVILTDFLEGNNFWEVCCFPAGFVPAGISITVSVWGGEEEITTDYVCISFSQLYCPLSYLHLTNLFIKFQLWDTSCRKPTSDPSKIVTFIKCFTFKFVKGTDKCKYHW